MEPIDIEENGLTFAENAIIKATAIAAKLPNMLILADDSGLSVPVLNNEPGLFSARYAGNNATDAQNMQKLCDNLKLLKLSKTKAFYTAAISLVFNRQIFTTHGFCYGEVIDTPKGDNGFGYDPIFIPKGYEVTFGQLGDEIKLSLSHRAKALALTKLFLQKIS
jgi:XTP/dITP diphosphohydrolase